MIDTPVCLSAGSGLLWAWAGGHEENSAADRWQPVGMETHRGRAAAGISDSGGGAPEDPRQTEDRAGPGVGWSPGEPGEVLQASVVTQRLREQREGESEPRAADSNTSPSWFCYNWTVSEHPEISSNKDHDWPFSDVVFTDSPQNVSSVTDDETSV